MYTNSLAPANHTYYSSSLNLLELLKRISLTSSPLDVSATNRGNSTTLNLLEQVNDNPTHSLWPYSQNSTICLPDVGLCWSLRECKEFFNAHNLKVRDSRNLLLDYSSHYSPLLKIFPVQGQDEVYFNFYTQQVSTSPVNLIEL